MPRLPLRLALAGGVAAALGLAGTALGGSDFKTQLISRASGAHGAAADNFSSNPAVSANGRFVAFLSNAANLNSADGADADLFVRDTQRQRTIFASRASGKHGEAANAYSNGTGISADGRFAVFYTAADNLNAADTNMTGDTYVRDLKQNRTILVSRASGKHGAVGLDSSTDPSISSSGRFVGFESSSDNLSDADDDNFRNVFVRDLDKDKTLLVSRRSGKDGAGATGGASENPFPSANGRFVAFYSRADNLSGADANGTGSDAFVRDLEKHRTILVSRASGKSGDGGDGDSFTPAISPNGRFVTFMSTADNLSGADDDSVTNVFVRDLKTTRTILVSRASGKHGAGGNGGSYGRSITADGRFIAFSSTADNLSGADANGIGQYVFVRDLKAHRTILVSRASGKHGAGGNGDSSNPKISYDGGVVAFESGADNLSAADDDTLENIFLRNGPF
jgi:hypothetical protein